MWNWLKRLFRRNTNSITLRIDAPRGSAVSIEGLLFDDAGLDFYGLEDEEVDEMETGKIKTRKDHTVTIPIQQLSDADCNHLERIDREVWQHVEIKIGPKAGEASLSGSVPWVLWTIRRVIEERIFDARFYGIELDEAQQWANWEAIKLVLNEG